ncbi:MAG: formylglycine-generating enzyme family protein [Bacillota bacterium]
MKQNLMVNKGKDLTKEKKQEIIEVVDQFIASQRNNNAILNKLAFDSITALTANEARAKELEQQGFLEKMWKNLTGQNQRLESQIEINRSKVLYASQKMIEKLRNENLLTFELITAVNNKFNGITMHIDRELRDLWEFIGKAKVNIEDRLTKIENDTKLLKWVLNIEHLKWGNQLYSDLDLAEQIICICTDFFSKTNGQWENEDILLIKKALKALDIDPKQKISLQNFHLQLSNNPKLIEQLVRDIPLDKLKVMKSYETPLLKGAVKLKNQNFSEQKDKLALVRNILKENSNFKPDFELEVFDLIVDLLLNLSIAATVEVKKVKKAPKKGLVLIKSGTNQSNPAIDLNYDVVAGKYPITNKEYIKFLNDYPVNKDGSYHDKQLIKISSRYIRIGHNGDEFHLVDRSNSADQPVVYVSWYGAVAYCNWLSKKENLNPVYDEIKWQPVADENLNNLNGYRLPSIKEWEYAAYGGREGAATKYSGSNKLTEVGWAFGETNVQQNPNFSNGLATMEVGQKDCNELGIYDLSGNVWEWTNSSNNSQAVKKGGSWRGNKSSCRISNSVKTKLEKTSSVLGFRVFRTF